MNNPIQYIYDDLGINKSDCSIFFNKDGATGSYIKLTAPSSYSGYNIEFPINNSPIIVLDSGISFGEEYGKLSLPNSGIDFNNFSILFNIFKTGVSPSLILGCMSTGSQVVNGFNIGINDAYKLFVETYSQNGPVIYTSSSILADNNMLSVRLDGSNLVISKYNPISRLLENESFIITPTEFWQETGIYDIYFGTAELTFTPYYSSFNGKFLLDSFVYHNQFLDDYNTAALLEGFHSNSVSEIININVETGIVTGSINLPLYGIEVTGYFKSGFASGDYVQTGYWVDEIVTINDPIVEITSGQLYFIGGGIRECRVACDDTSGTNSYTSSIFQNALQFVPRTGYEYIPITGLVITGYQTELLYNTGTSSIANETFSIELDYDKLNLYNQNKISIINYPTGAVDFYEFITNSGRDNTLNIPALFSDNEKEHLSTIKLDEYFGYSNELIYLNGQLLTRGSAQETTIGYSSSYSIISGNYDIDENVIKTEFLISGSDILDIDIASGARRLYEIRVPLDYSSVLKSGQIFLNGLKLYSGIHFNSGGFFGVNDITGYLYCVPNYANSISSTGENMMSVTGEIYEDRSIVFINGMKMDKTIFIEHSSKYDLINSMNLIELNTSSLDFEL